MMHIMLGGLRRFMADVDARCTAGTDLTTILVGQGFTPDQVDVLRRHHLAAFMEACRVLIRERLLLRHDGERLIQIVERRYGLDGAAPETLARLGAAMGISRERVRQLEGKALGYCRAPRMAWVESLGQIAAGFVGAPALPPQETSAAQGASPAAATPAQATRSPMPVTTYTRTEIAAMVAAIEERVGTSLRVCRGINR